MGIVGRNICCLAVLLLSVSISQAKEVKPNESAEVIVEVKFVHLDQSVLEKLKQQGLFKESKGKEVLSLDKARMIRFMQVASSDINCKFLAIAKLAMRDGETALRSCGDEQHFVTGLEIVSRNGQIEYIPKKETLPLGPQIRIRSHVSTDRRRVRVCVDAKVNNLDSPTVPRFRITTPAPFGESATVTHFIERPKISTYGVERTMVIPDGNTAVLMGGTFQCVQATVSKVPTLGDVPYLGILFRSVTYEVRQQYLLVLVTPRILVPQDTEEKSTSQNKQKPRPTSTPNPLTTDPEDKNDFRTLILPPIREGETRKPDIVPSETRILRAMSGTINKPGVWQEFRDDIQIVKKCLVNKVDPPRFFPLVGRAQLHHCRWKCTVSYNERILVSWPIPFVSTRPRKAVIFLDLDHLHLVPVETPLGGVKPDVTVAP